MRKILLYFFACIFCKLSFSQTFTENIQPLIQLKCMPCHSPGNVGAMPLSSFNDVKAYAAMIQYVTENRLMPPNKAEDQYSKLDGNKTLLTEEINAIKNWIKNGMPEGTKKEISMEQTVKKYEVKPKPDQELFMSHAFITKSDYSERQQVFVFELKNTTAQNLESINFKPGNKRIVKSATISIDTGKTGNLLDGYDDTYGYSAPTSLAYIPYAYNFYQWVPQQLNLKFRLPLPVYIPANANLILAIQYAATETKEMDSSSVQLFFQQEKDDLPALHSEVLFDSSNMVNKPFEIGPGVKRKFYFIKELTKNITIFSLMPYGQHALSSCEIYAIDPWGKRINLLKIPFWDAHWKQKYYLKNPVYLPAGSKIMSTNYYNNGDDNPSLIILPPKKIHYGEGQRDELAMVLYDYMDQ